jgi:hypothetical protein
MKRDRMRRVRGSWTGSSGTVDGGRRRGRPGRGVSDAGGWAGCGRRRAWSAWAAVSGSKRSRGRGPSPSVTAPSSLACSYTQVRVTPSCRASWPASSRRASPSPRTGSLWRRSCATRWAICSIASGVSSAAACRTRPQRLETRGCAPGVLWRSGGRKLNGGTCFRWLVVAVWSAGLSLPTSLLSSGGGGFCQGRAVRPRRRRPRRGGLDGFRPRSYEQHRRWCPAPRLCEARRRRVCRGELMSAHGSAGWGSWLCCTSGYAGASGWRPVWPALRSWSMRSSVGGWVCSVSQMKGMGWSWMSA